MKAVIKVEKEIDIKYVKVELPVRYDDEDIPYDFPLRKGSMWVGTIDIETGGLLNWPKGESGEMFMKVCDMGVYSLLDDEQEVLLTLEDGSYVPNHLLPPRDGYGDYVKFIIDKDGVITNWYKNPSIDDFLE